MKLEHFLTPYTKIINSNISQTLPKNVKHILWAKTTQEKLQTNISNEYGHKIINKIQKTKSGTILEVLYTIMMWNLLQE